MPATCEYSDTVRSSTGELHPLPQSRYTLYDTGTMMSASKRGTAVLPSPAVISTNALAGMGPPRDVSVAAGRVGGKGT